MFRVMRSVLLALSVAGAVALPNTTPRLRRKMVLRREMNETIYSHHTVAANDNTTLAMVPRAQHNTTKSNSSAETEPKTGALEWAGMLDPESPAPTSQSITVSAPMGNQGGGLTTSDVPNEMPFGGGILNTPSEKEAVVEEKDKEEGH